MLVDGARSGFASIPLMYLASTSTTKFLTPIRYALSDHRAQNRPYSSSFGWGKQDSQSLSVIDPKWEKQQMRGFSALHWQSRNPMAICDVSMVRMTGAADV